MHIDALEEVSAVLQILGYDEGNDDGSGDVVVVSTEPCIVLRFNGSSSTHEINVEIQVEIGPGYPTTQAALVKVTTLMSPLDLTLQLAELRRLLNDTATNNLGQSVLLELYSVMKEWVERAHEITTQDSNDLSNNMEGISRMQSVRSMESSLKEELSSKCAAMVLHDDHGDLLQLHGKSFCIFMSSTFADFSAERTALQSIVFPILNDYCEWHGAQLQICDLRWSIRDDDVRDHNVVAICMKEIRRCQSISRRPNFMSLLSCRYGWRPLPPTIPLTVFEEIMGVTTDISDVQLLKENYQVDRNAMPSAEAVLGRAEKYSTWEFTERRLHSILQTAVEIILKQESPVLKRLKDVDAITYDLLTRHCSITELEIREGIARAPGYKEDIHCFIREISGLPADPKDARGFSEFDKDSATMLDALKNEVIPNLLPKSNVHRYDCQWTGADTQPTTLHHLRQFCEDVFNATVTSLKKEILSFSKELELKRIESESHLEFANRISRLFVGRDADLSLLHSYVSSTADSRPLFVSGNPGSGKTTVLAKFLVDMKKSSSVNVICRFVGATPGSTVLPVLLQDISNELQAGSIGNAATKESSTTSLSACVGSFHSALASAASKKVVVIVDSLDQILATPSQAILWIPRVLPSPNCKIILSVAAGTPVHSLLQSSSADAVSSTWLNLGPLSGDESFKMVNSYLQAHGRCVTEEQTQLLRASFGSCSLPLYLHLVSVQAMYWTSQVAFQHLSIGQNIRAVIGNFFQWLTVEQHQPPMLVRAALSQIYCSRSGLTESELRVCLASDADVWGEFKATSYHVPVDRKLPLMVWARLHALLEPYTTLRVPHGALPSAGSFLIGLYHNEFGAAICSEFLSCNQYKQQVHRLLASYFAHLPHNITTGNDAGQLKPCLRKLHELPYQLLNAVEYKALSALLGDPSFIEAKIRSGMQADLLRDLACASSECSEPSLKAFFNELTVFVQSEIHILQHSPASVLQLMLNRPEDSTVCQIARAVVSNSFFSSDDASSAATSPMVTELTRGGSGEEGGIARMSSLMTVVNRNTSSSSTKSGKSLISKDLPAAAEEDHTVEQMVPLKPGELQLLSYARPPAAWFEWINKPLKADCSLLTIFHGSAYLVSCCMIHNTAESARLNFVSAHADGSLLLWDSVSGELVRALNVGPQAASSTSVHRADHVLSSVVHVEALRAIAVVGKAYLALHSDDTLLPVSKPIEASDLGFSTVCCSENGRMLVVGTSTGGILLYSVSKNEDGSGFVLNPRFQLQGCHAGAIKCSGFAPGNKIFATGGLDSIAKVWEITVQTTVRELQLLQGHTGAVRSLTFSSGGKVLITGSADTTVRLWRWMGDEHGNSSNFEDNFEEQAANINTTTNISKPILIQTLAGHVRPVNCVVKLISRGHLRVASVSGDRNMRLWKSIGASTNRGADGNALCTISAHRKGVHCCDWDRLDRLLTASRNEICMWSLSTAMKIKKGGSDRMDTLDISGLCHSLKFSKDGDRIAICIGKRIGMFHCNSGSSSAPICTFDSQQQEGTAMACAFTSNFGLVTAYKDGSLVYRLPPILTLGVNPWSVATSGDGAAGMQSSKHKAHHSPVQGISFFSNTTDIDAFVTIGMDCSFKIWQSSVSAFRPVQVFTTGIGTQIRCVAAHPRKYLIGLGCEDGTFRTYVGCQDEEAQDEGKEAGNDVPSRWRVHFVKFAHEASIESIAAVGFPAVASGIGFVTGGKNGQILVWDVDECQKSCEFEGHQKSVTGCCWVAGTSVLVTASSDCTVRVWDVSSQSQIGRFELYTKCNGAIDLHVRRKKRGTMRKSKETEVRVAVVDAKGILYLTVLKGEAVARAVPAMDGRKQRSQQQQEDDEAEGVAVPEDRTRGRWHWLNSDKRWHPYPDEVNAVIEQGFKTGAREVYYHNQTKKQEFALNFSDMMVRPVQQCHGYRGYRHPAIRWLVQRVVT